MEDDTSSTTSTSEQDTDTPSDPEEDTSSTTSTSEQDTASMEKQPASKKEGHKPAASDNSGQPQEEEEIDDADLEPDILGPHQIVLLGNSSIFMKKLRRASRAKFGADNVSFQEAESLARYKAGLRKICRNSPDFVLLDIFQQYADSGMNLTTFQNLILYHITEFQNNRIPCAFMLPTLNAEEMDNKRLASLHHAVLDLCQIHGIRVFQTNEIDPIVKHIEKEKR